MENRQGTLQDRPRGLQYTNNVVSGVPADLHGDWRPLDPFLVQLPKTALFNNISVNDPYIPSSFVFVLMCGDTQGLTGRSRSSPDGPRRSNKL